MVELKCGLEIHVYINVDNKRKLFCNCLIDDSEPNTNICPTCTAQPGAKPLMPNKEAMEKVLAISLMFGCKINNLVIFQRKHYSWPDLPSGYQRTMSGSYATALGENGEFMGIGIEGIHLEEDPAKWDPNTGLVDYNRSGRPLAEIVTKPDFRSAEQVREWLRALIAALRTLNAIDETAGIKADVNVSIAPAYGRVEVKNINSFKAIADALEYEVRRQEHEVNDGKVIKRETRAWHDETSRTVFMREKETAQDYMFIPDPDLPAIRISEGIIEAAKIGLPQRPDVKAEIYVKKGVDADDARIIASYPAVSASFEEVIKKVDPVFAAKFYRKELLRVLNLEKKEINETKLTSQNLIELLHLLKDSKISDLIARKLLEKAVKEELNIKMHVESEGLESKDHGTEIYDRMISENPKAIEDFKAGKEAAINFIVGKIIKELKGAVDAKKVKEELVKRIQNK